MTREQLATWCCTAMRAARKPPESWKALRMRAKCPPMPGNAVEWAVERKILAGKGNGVLDPRGSATRAEVAAVLMRYEMSRVLLSPQ